MSLLDFPEAPGAIRGPGGEPRTHGYATPGSRLSRRSAGTSRSGPLGYFPSRFGPVIIGPTLPATIGKRSVPSAAS